MAQLVRSETGLALQRRRWLLGLGLGWVLVFCVSVAVMYSSQALIEGRLEVFCSLGDFLICGPFGSGVVGLFVSYVVIDLSQALIITRVARFLDLSGCNFLLIPSIMGHHA